MAEYIERKAFLDALKQERKKGNFVFTSQWIREILDDLPTADVVPRAEVEKLKKEYEEEISELEREIEDMESTQEITPEAKYLVDTKADKIISLMTEISKTQNEVKQAVAREIFAELMNCRVFRTDGIEGYVKVDIDELKKKYKESE